MTDKVYVLGMAWEACREDSRVFRLDAFRTRGSPPEQLIRCWVQNLHRRFRQPCRCLRRGQQCRHPIVNRGHEGVRRRSQNDEARAYRFVSGRHVFVEEPGQQDWLAIRSVEPQRLTAVRASLPLEEAIRRDHAASGCEGVFEGRLYCKTKRPPSDEVVITFVVLVQVSSAALSLNRSMNSEVR